MFTMVAAIVPARSSIPARLAVAAVCLAVLAGCTGRGAAQQASNPAGVAGCHIPSAAPVDPSAVLVPGPNRGLPPSPVKGERLVLTAIVLDPSCSPAAAASVNIWHTDAHGDYGPSREQECCYYAGLVTTDHNGHFRLETIRPAQYPQPNAPPAHIHVEIQHASGRLMTEVVFTANPNPPNRAVQSDRVPTYLTAAGTAENRSWTGEVAFVLLP